MGADKDRPDPPIEDTLDPSEDDDLDLEPDDESLSVLGDLLFKAARAPEVPVSRLEQARAPLLLDRTLEARFELRRRLGEGGFGVVYEACDRKREAVVALKVLQKAHPSALYHFKKGFRALADLNHPNIATLYELMSGGEHWFFTMELLDGVDFIEHIRAGFVVEDDMASLPTHSTNRTEDALDEPSVEIRVGTKARPGPFDEVRLRAALAQLAEGIRALHAAGHLHRDIKPSNVMVTGDGRVVLLDFGLVTELEPSEGALSVGFAGTPAYMSPEQRFGKPLSAASDWYSVGVMLYEALTGGRPPAPPRPPEVPLAAPSALVEGVPEDLDALCMALLSEEVEGRAGAEVVLSRMVPEASVEASPAGASVPFVGREQQLSSLMGAFEAMWTGTPSTVHLHGASGIGKSALVRRFLAQVRGKHPSAVVLTGRCYAQETVPYKALDSVIDALSRTLSHLPEAEVRALLPRDVLALARLFPVLKQVDAVVRARRRVLDIPDGVELRRRASAAFKELLARIADERPLVVLIDDLQWGDLDSAALLLDMLRPPDPPQLLFVACYRTDEAAQSALVGALLASEGARVDLPLDRLAPDEIRHLARLLASGHALDEQHFKDIERDSSGNPFFIAELVGFLQRESLTSRSTSGTGSTRARLDAVLRRRFDRLSDDARRLLEVVALAGTPLPRAVAAQAAELGPRGPEALSVLLSQRLVRITAHDDRIEAYHDRIREAAVGALSPERLAVHHGSLGEHLEAARCADPETLLIHFQRSGQMARAAGYAAEAAEVAFEALAFTRAARLFRLALDLAQDDADRQPLQKMLGEALGQSGRGPEAAEVYLKASQSATDETEVMDLKRRAAEHLLNSGHRVEGLELFHELLAEVDMALPGPRGVIPALLARRAHLALRGLGYKERDISEVSPRDLLRLDLCWAGVNGLGSFEPILGSYLSARFLLLALRAGEPYRISLGLSVTTAYMAIYGGRARKRLQERTEMATSLAKRLDHPHALGLARFAEGLVAMCQGRWRAGLEGFEEAHTLFVEHTTGIIFERDISRFYASLCVNWLGRWRENIAQLPTQLRQAEERADRFGEICYKAFFGHLPHLAVGDVERAERAIEHAESLLPERPVIVQHWYNVHARVELSLYTGEALAAWRHLDAWWPRLERAFIFDIQIVHIDALYHRGRCALALLQHPTEGAPPASKLQRQLRADTRRIDRERMLWGMVLSHLLKGCLAAHQGDPHAAEQAFEACEEAAIQTDMALFAAIARRRRGQVTDGGSELIEDADAWLKGQGIADPRRLTRMMAP